MTPQYEPVYQPLVPIRIFDFSGGLNTHDSPFAVRANQLSDGNNWWVNPYPAISRRPGYAQLHTNRLICIDTTVLGTNPQDSKDEGGPEGSLSIHAIAGLHEFENLAGTARDILVFLGNGPIYRLNLSLQLLEGTAGYHPAGPITEVCGVSANNRGYYAVGKGQLLVWHSSRMYKAGLPAPVAAPATQASSTPGAGSWTYKVTWTNSNGVESNPSPATSPATTRREVFAPGIATTDTEIPLPEGYFVTGWNIYRTVTNGTVWLKLAEKTLSQLSHDDTAADSALGTAVSVDHDEPPQKLQILQVYKNCLVGVETDTPYRIWYSKAGEFEHWPPSNYIDCRSQENSRIEGLAVLFDTLVTLLYDSIWHVTGSPGSFSARRMVDDIGSASWRTVVNINNQIHFLSSTRGFHAWNGMQAIQTGHNILSTILAIDPDDLEAAHSAHWRAEHMYVTAIAGIWWVYDYIHQLWQPQWDSKDTNGMTTCRCIATAHGTDDKEIVLFGDNDQRVYRFGVTNSDGGDAPIDAGFFLGWMDGGLGTNKSFQDVILYTSPQAGIVVVMWQFWGTWQSVTFQEIFQFGSYGTPRRRTRAKMYGDGSHCRLYVGYQSGGEGADVNPILTLHGIEVFYRPRPLGLRGGVK